MLIATAPARATDRVPKAPPTASGVPSADSSAAPDQGVLFRPESVTSSGSVTVEGSRIDYTAVAGTIVVHPKGWDDAARRERQGAADLGDRPDPDRDAKDGDKDNPQAEASMFYVAYFKKGVSAKARPITFLYNGGPGSSSVWLHMGAFGPRRVVTADDTHTAAAPYRLIDNDYSLLDASDLVFIDAPATGFSRVAGKDKEKAFFGIDADAYAFEQFIKGFLSRHGRWNSPKYLFGESYGTPRSAVVVNGLTTENDIDFNGVMLLSQILSFDLSADSSERNPGIDQAYITTLPTFAATAWYHHALPGPQPAALEPFLKEVERFATTDYALALQQGSELDAGRRAQIADRIARYTGLPAAYILKSDLRVNGGQFAQMLLGGQDAVTGRLDSRFVGPAIDPLAREATYDPQSASISSAYVSLFNDYVRADLHYGQGKDYKPESDAYKTWDMRHKPPGVTDQPEGGPNVMPDLANAMKYDPKLKVMVAGGYFDLATPFFEGWYEMHHLPIPAALAGNIEYHYYQSGHMVYANEAALKTLHDDAADFIARTGNLIPARTAASRHNSATAASGRASPEAGAPGTPG